MRRTMRWLGRSAVVLLIALVLAELLLQGAALFARDRSGGWRAGAARKILCVGDSHTFGAAVPPEESYPGHLQRLLDERAPGAYSVVNLGIPGMNTTLVRDRLRAALAEDRPDLVLVWCGANNAWNRTESSGTQSGWSFGQALLRLRVYRLVQTWRQDRHLDSVLAQILSADQQRAELVFEVDPATRQQRFTVMSGDRTERLTFEDTGFRADADMEERAVRDFRLMVQDCRAAGVPIAFVTYPIDEDAFRVANQAIRRVAAESGAPVIETAPAVARVPPDEQQWLWAAHPDGRMYGEIARNVMQVALGEPPAELKFDVDARSDGAVVTGPCSRTTTGCAAGSGCYRWNPRQSVCNVQQTVISSKNLLRLSARFRVAAFPSGTGGYDVLSLIEDTYGTGIYVQFTNRDQLRLFAMGREGAEPTCGPLRARVVPDVWYELRVRAEKSDHARATLELLTAAGEVVDTVTCTDLPAGGGAFTTLSVGSRSPFGATAEVTVDDVTVHEEPG